MSPRRLALIAIFVMLLVPALAVAQTRTDPIPALAVVSDELPEPAQSELRARRRQLLQERNVLRARWQAHDVRCRGLRVGSPALAECQAAQGPLSRSINDHAAASRQFNDDVAHAGGPPPLTSPQIERIVREVRNIRVPPPIGEEEVAFKFALPASDARTVHGMHAAEGLLALGQVIIRGGGVTLPVLYPVIVAANVTFAQADAAEVYVVRQTDTYERALGYLKDPATRVQFAAVVTALREHRPIPGNASIDMARAAQAIVDVGSGNTTGRIFWGAMFSPGAKAAAVTRALIEAVSFGAGHGAKEILQHVRLAREPGFNSAVRAAAAAQAEMKSAQTEAARAAAEAAFREADAVIAASYRTYTPGERGMEHIIKMHVAEELARPLEKQHR